MANHRAGECWTYRTPEGYAQSRLIIGGVVSFEGHEPVICCSIIAAPTRQADGSHAASTIPFLPLTLTAFEQTVVSLEGQSRVPAEFPAALEAWRKDPKGLTFFTVPFEGSMERLIANQMAQIVGADVNAA